MTQVTKRDGRSVEFCPDKIEVAVQKALDANHVVESSPNLAYRVAQDVNAELTKNKVDRVHVEAIQDMVEQSLMIHSPSTAKTYILYRQKKAEARESAPDPKAMEDYILRSKYARWNAETGKRESYEEAVDRLLLMHDARLRHCLPPTSLAKTTDAMVLTRRLIKGKKILPSMRSLQFGGRAIEVNNARMFNCSYTLIDRPRVFGDIFFLLLSGCGVGYSVRRHHVAELPPVLNIDRSDVKTFEVPDTIEGWAMAVNSLVLSMLDPEYVWGGSYVEFDYYDIRPQGAELKTTCGKAPGHVPLKRALEAIRAVLEGAQGRSLTTVEAHEMVCHLAEGVLAGGIRRSSLWCGFSPEDMEMRQLKTGNWWETKPHLAMANNTICFNRNRSNFGEFQAVFKHTREFGEPGFAFFENDEDGYNPCAEIGMSAKDDEGNTGFNFCNLTEINMARIEDEEDFERAVRGATFLGTLQATYDDVLDCDATRRIIDRDRLLGVSLTGQMDNPVVTQSDILLAMAQVARETNDFYAELLGINSAARITCGKPSGTASLLLGGVGNGCHPHHSKRYIRRVTANAEEPVFQHFRETNPHMCQKKPNGDWVIEFPILAPEGAICREDIGAIGMLEHIKMIMLYWIRPGGKTTHLTHNQSATVHIKPEEWDDAIIYFWNNREQFGAVSFLEMGSESAYSFLPKEAVETEAQMTAWKALIRDYRQVDYDTLTESSDNTVAGPACEGAACEI